MTSENLLKKYNKLRKIKKYIIKEEYRGLDIFQSKI